MATTLDTAPIRTRAQPGPVVETYAEHVQRIANEAPPLTVQQAKRLAGIFSSALSTTELDQLDDQHASA